MNSNIIDVDDIGEVNGVIQEYYVGKLKYEGEDKNGKKMEKEKNIIMVH